jgi:UDP-glucose 4-epimerase
VISQVRSGRSRRAAGGAPGADVVVVGPGALAVAMTAVWDGSVRVLDALPEREPHVALAGARVLVVVAHPGDLSAPAVRGSATEAALLVAATQRTLSAARDAGVQHVVVVTSAMVHGAWPDRPVIHDGDDLTHPDEADRSGFVGGLLAVEAVAARASRRRTPVLTVLRPAALVGPGIDTFVTRHFEAPRLLTVRGAVRTWQFVHVDDVASAARFAVDHGLAGPLTVGASDELTPAQVEAAAGMRRIELAASTAFGTAERLHRVGVLRAPAAELAYVVYPWTVAADGLRAAGWEPRWTSAACLEVLLAGVRGRLAVGGRRVGTGGAAALGAAGAAVALIGTAAVLRQARGRRRT